LALAARTRAPSFSNSEMSYYLLALGLVAHAYFWGAGLAAIALPREWKRMWWVFAPAFGIALQSSVVWFGVKLDWPGTDSYARFSLVIPAALLVVAFFRRPRALLRFKLSRPLLVAAALAVLVGWLVISPLTVPGKGIYPA